MIEAYDPSALDAFRTELLEAGFEVVEGSGGVIWRCEAPSALQALGSGPLLELRIHDGWPYRQPSLHADGLATEHAARGIICLWRTDDPSLEWVSLSAILTRLDRWCDSVEGGFTPVDAALDAWVNFDEQELQMFSFDTEYWASPRDGTSGALNIRESGPFLVEASPGAGGGARGIWLYRDQVDVPPSDLESVRNLLTGAQAEKLDRLVRQVVHGDRDDSYVLMLWAHHGALDAIPMRISAQAGSVRVVSLQPAPNDLASTLVRAGSAAVALQNRSAVVFGVGAIGSHLSLLLACSGVGTMTLVDHDQLRPTNVVRHAAGSAHIGFPKTLAMRAVIADHASFVDVRTDEGRRVSPSELRALIEPCDLAIDATGNSLVTDAISRTCAEQSTPLISVAMFRQGQVGRVRVQESNKTPLFERRGGDRFPVIPAGDDIDDVLETGCDSPVNPAPPYVASLVGANGARLAVQLLTGSIGNLSELISVYGSLPEEGWSQPGDRYITEQ